MESRHSENLFFIESEPLKEDSYKFNLHISCANLDVANTLFERMKNKWKLPVEIQGNRIIVSPAKDYTSPGTYQYDASMMGGYECAGIRFSNQTDAKEFFDFSKSTNDNENEDTKIPDMECNYGAIFFVAKTLFSFKFNLNKRILRDSKTLIALNTRFSLDNQGITTIELPKKITCHLQYSPSNESKTKHNLHLICSNPDDTKILFDTILFQFSNKKLDLDNDQIIITPYYSGTIGRLTGSITNESLIGIAFSPDSFRLFSLFVTVLDKDHLPIRFDKLRTDSFYCPIELIPEFNNTHVSALVKINQLNLPLTIETLPLNSLPQTIAMMIEEMHNYIDNVILGNFDLTMETTRPRLLSWANPSDPLKDEKFKCLQHLKECIREGLDGGKTLDTIKSAWLGSIGSKAGIKDSQETIQAILLTNQSGEKVKTTKIMELVNAFFDDFQPGCAKNSNLKFG